MKNRAVLALVGSIAVGAALGQAVLIGTAEIPVSIALQEEVVVIPEPPTIDIGRINLGDANILQNVHVTVSNVDTSLWAYVVDKPGGWTLAPSPGPDKYTITVNEIPMTGEPQQVFPLVQAYGTTAVGFIYSAPTSDSFGGGVDQGYALRIEARHATIDPGDPGID